MTCVAQRYLEREVKMDVDTSFSLPELNDLVPAGGILDSVVIDIDSMYFDTAQLDLLASGVTLRRRVGGSSDTGWQLKLPTGDARTEVRLPPTQTATVPKELRDLSAGVRRGRQVRQTARLRVKRTAHRVLDAGGELVVEIADDQVHATAFGEQAVISEWREVEVELGAGDERLQRRIVKRLARAGARDSASASKLGRALADTAATVAAPNGIVPTRAPERTETVGDIVIGYLIEQRDAVRDGDLDLRSGVNAVHYTRVATRRFRSTLRTYGSLFDTERAAALDTELAWYAGVLGAVRDIDVLRDHLEGAITALPAHLVLGPVAARVEQYLAGERARDERTMIRTLNGRRYFALLDAIDEWIADPPFTADADQPAKHTGEWAKRAQRKLAKRLAVAAADDDPATSDPANVHRARKAAKRARYAFELAAPELPAKTATRRIKKLKKMQDTLGDFQDSVVANDTLLLLGIRAGTAPGENGFTFGMLYALEQRRAEVSRRRVLDKLR